ncbi:hypothetical protein [Marinicella gelatinilytica]|uniref:hypothetical protein n=1 Tax=Marinicella gelatinilytica TaxID=2996017 RepID=UPI002260C605|nr:hypothetical protein [Marinicella gelatinilytica]MCX7546087.1 hypothetical protein [Marinicella gelatinilytica]
MSNIVELNWSNPPKGAKFEYNGWERIPKGEYEASFLTWTTFRMGGMSRVIWLFSITDMGKYFNKTIPMFFNAKLKKRTGLRGHFKPPPRGKLLKIYYKLRPHDPELKRLDRIPLTKLESKIYKIKVVDVTHDYQQNPLPEQMIYSKVDDVELI